MVTTMIHLESERGRNKRKDHHSGTRLPDKSIIYRCLPW
jgi:hypothetical protein